MRKTQNVTRMRRCDNAVMTTKHVYFDISGFSFVELRIALFRPRVTYSINFKITLCELTEVGISKYSYDSKFVFDVTHADIRSLSFNYNSSTAKHKFGCQEDGL